MPVDAPGQSHVEQFGVLLRQHRVAATLSQEALAERAGVSARAVSDLERGVKLRPHLETVRMLADALRLSSTDRMTLAVASRPGTAPFADDQPRPVSSSTIALTLPIPPTLLVGRSEAATRAVRLIREERVRLLTLTGPGGVGKSRLALAIGTELHDEFPDGVAWVELAPVSDPTDVADTILRALAEPEPRSVSSSQALRETLRHRRALLILDNCEHQRESTAQLVAELLPHCPDLAILATSRVSLRLTAEHLFPVEPLPVPALESDQSAESVGQSDAVKLFVLRAQSTRPGFALTEQNAPDIAAICRRLDGLPLAIELAAARARVLSPDALLPLLDSRFRVLAGGSDDLPARHQTLHAALDWSYELLDDVLRARFRALSACAGGFTLESARAITEVSDPLALLEDLEQLVDHSLISVNPAPGDNLRFTMLETVREYGREQLALSGEDGEVRDRHAAWFLQLAETAEPELSGAHQATWLRLLDSDRDNLRQALAWFHQNERREELLRLGAALWPYWSRRGGDDEVRGWLDRAIDPNGSDPSTLTKSYHRLGNLAIDLGDYPRARQMFSSSLNVAESMHDQVAIANALNGLGVVASDTGDLNEARSLHGRSLAIRRKSEDKVGVARSLYNLGLVDAAVGNIASARRHLLEALEIKEYLNDAAGIAYSEWALAAIDIRESNPESARELLTRSLNVFTELGDDHGLAYVLTEAGSLALLDGDNPKAYSLILEALEIHHRLGDRLAVIANLERLALAGPAGIEMELAAMLLGATERLRASIGVPRTSIEQERISALHKDCLDELGAERFAQAFVSSSAKSTDQVIAAARELGPAFLEQ